MPFLKFLREQWTEKGSLLPTAVLVSILLLFIIIAVTLSVTYSPLCSLLIVVGIAVSMLLAASLRTRQDVRYGNLCQPKLETHCPVYTEEKSYVCPSGWRFKSAAVSEPCLCCRTFRLPRRSFSSPKLLPNSGSLNDTSAKPPSWTLGTSRGTGDEHSAVAVLNNMKGDLGNIPFAHNSIIIYRMFGEATAGYSGCVPFENSKALFVSKSTSGRRHRVSLNLHQDGDWKAGTSRKQKPFCCPLQPETALDVRGSGKPSSLCVEEDKTVSKDRQANSASLSSSGARRTSDVEEGCCGADGSALKRPQAAAQRAHTRQDSGKTSTTAAGDPSKDISDINAADDIKLPSPGMSTSKSINLSGPCLLYGISFPSRGVQSATDVSNAGGSLLTLPNMHFSLASGNPSVNASVTDSLVERVRSWLYARNPSSSSALTPESAVALQDTDSIWRSLSWSADSCSITNEDSQHSLPGSSGHQRRLVQVPQWVKIEVENLADAYTPSQDSDGTRRDTVAPSQGAVMKEGCVLQGEVPAAEGGVETRRAEVHKKKKRKRKLISRIFRWKKKRGRGSK